MKSKKENKSLEENNVDKVGEGKLKKSASKINIYQRKLTYLKRVVVFNVIITITLAILAIGSYILYLDEKKESDKKEKDLKAYIVDVENKTEEIKTKIEDARKYNKAWETSDDIRKSFEGIKVDSINEILANLSEKHQITNTNMKISIPETASGGVYDNNAISVVFSNVSLSFVAIDDRKTIYFLRDFIANLPGYITVTKLEVKKSKETGYDQDDLIKISSGEIVGIVAATLEFTWHTFKKK